MAMDIGALLMPKDKTEKSRIINLKILENYDKPRQVKSLVPRPRAGTFNEACNFRPELAGVGFLL